MRRFAWLAAFLGATAFAHEAVQAQLVFSFSQPTLTGLPGTTLHFGGTLTNPLGTSLFLNGDNFSIASGAFTLDDTPFFIGVPAFLSPGGMYSGPLFDVVIGLAATPGVYGGTFTILGGANSNATNTLASQTFSVTVSTSVTPEPSSFVLMLTALVGLGALGRTRGSWLKRKAVAA